MQNEGKETVSSFEPYITLQDVAKMTKRADLPVTREQMVAAFSASKMTQICEYDKSSILQLGRIFWVEFLECFCRLSLQSFVGTEMDDCPLSEKLPFTIKKVFGASQYVPFAEEFVEMYALSDGDSTPYESEQDSQEGYVDIPEFTGKLSVELENEPTE
jgi:hypothetical protein